ncbi:hypothetical protein NDU88_003354 [Pleurodeles waltl]|uniref:Uncharacterized protein n=1 Tax=Pleurodeles waltl TaxID=8319 RepID=A0AAV7W1W7_PLEWA|nr:hypothetical protein NDU88_003354 [Pleurodeles waltl]
MGRHKRTDASQGNTMEQYTTLVVLLQRVARLEVSGDNVGMPLNTEEPSRAKLLAPIQGSRVALEGKIETVAVEVNLLRAGLRKVAESSIAELQTEVGALRKQIVQATSTLRRLEAGLEDTERRSRQNNVRLLGFPECAEGSAMEFFVANWIRDVLQPTGLSRVFVVERAHRALVAPPRPGEPPRAIIARLQKYEDLDCVLRAIRDWDKALYKNCKISSCPDYTNNVQSSRKGFNSEP